MPSKRSNKQAGAKGRRRAAHASGRECRTSPAASGPDAPGGAGSPPEDALKDAPAGAPESCAALERPDPVPGSGALFVVATPIGNLGDITLRAIETLRTVHRIAAEDTRHTRKLLSRYDIHTPLVSYHEHNAKERGPELVARMLGGECLAVVTDAGTPGISDPGTPLVQAAIEAGIPVTVIPGPAALIAALVASGLATHPFVFLGFPPNRATLRERFFRTYAALPMTLVFYESPKRLGGTLDEMLRVFGDRRIAVARELTKIHEEVFRGRVSGALAHFSGEVQGEVAIILEGAGEVSLAAQDRGEAVSGEPGSEEGPCLPATGRSPSDAATAWQETLRRLILADGLSVREASETVSSRYSIPRKTVYRQALKVKKDS